MLPLTYKYINWCSYSNGMVLKDIIKIVNSRWICPFSVFCSWTFWVIPEKKRLTLRGYNSQTASTTWTYRVSVERSCPYLSLGTLWHSVWPLVWSQMANEKLEYWCSDRIIYLMSILYSMSDKVVEENAIVGKAWFSFYPQKVADTMYKVKRDKSFPGVCRYGRWCHSKSLRLLPLILTYLFCVVSTETFIFF